MQNILLFLQGKKTYILATAYALTAFASFLLGETSLAELVNKLLEAGGVASLRAGISKGA